MLRMLAVIAATAATMSMLAACSGGGASGTPSAVTAPAPELPDQASGTLEKGALAEAADTNCGYSDALSARLGPRGKTLAGIQAESAGTLPVFEEVQGLQAALEPAGPVAGDWKQYLDASQGVIDAGQAVVDAEGEAEAQRAFAALDQARQKTYPPADALGLKVCTFAAEATVEETTMEDPENFNLAEPTNAPEQAADELISAIDSGDCEKINAQRHSDAGDLSPQTCEYLITGYSGLDVVGSQSYGPAAMVQFASGEDASRQGTTQFVIDSDGKLKYVNESVIVGGGIHPPSEGFDAQETMDAVLEAVREEDSVAFTETLGPDGAYFEAEDPLAEFLSEPSGKVVAETIRDNPEVEAVMIGANQALAFFIFDTENRDLLLEIGHSPGSETNYRNPGYWALPASSS
jgi:hypothetical protein